LPFLRQLIQLHDHLFYIFHALGYTVRHRRWDAWFIVTENEARVLKHAQPFGKNARRNTFDLLPQYPKPQGAIVTQDPEYVHRPGTRE
jgi:hypothetical protein